MSRADRNDRRFERDADTTPATRQYDPGGRGVSLAASEGTMTASILVVDDESPPLDTLGTFLEGEGYRVATAGGGREALSRIEAEEFDVIVTDLVMPGVSGLDLLEESRRLSPGVSVILISGHATVETA